MGQGMFPAKIYVGQIAVVFGIVVTSTWGATQWAAHALGYQDGLAAGVIDKDAMPIDKIDVRPPLEEIGNVSKRSRQQRIVTVQVRHDVAVDACEPQVDRVCLPFIRLAPPRDPVAIVLQDIDGVVDRSSILDMNDSRGWF